MQPRNGQIMTGLEGCW